MNKFDADSKFGTFTSKGRIDLKEVSDIVTLDLSLDSVNDYTKEYVSAMIDAIRAVSKEAQNFRPSNQDQENFKNILTQHVDEVTALVPRMDEFGTVKFNHEVKIDFDKKKFETDVNLSKLEFTSALYGVHLTGGLKAGEENYSGSFTLDLSKYTDLVRDIISYYNRVILVLNRMQPGQNYPLIPDHAGQDVIEYVRAISNAPEKDSKDVSITASYLDGKTKVGTLSLPDFLKKTEELRVILLKEFEPKGAQETPPVEHAPQAAPQGTEAQQDGAESHVEHAPKQAPKLEGQGAK